MKVEIDGVNYVPEGQPPIKLNHRVYDSTERLLWDIYSWYTHQVWEAGRHGDEDDLKQCVKDCEMFERCVEEMFGMYVPDNEYRFVEMKERDKR